MGRRRPPHILTPVKAAGLHYANALTPAQQTVPVAIAWARDLLHKR